METRDKPARAERGREKTARNPVKVAPSGAALARKPPWIRVRLHDAPAVARLKSMIRGQGLHTVCEEAACPNLHECYANGTATFMIMGDVCTRRCPFCRCRPLDAPRRFDANEPAALGQTIAAMGLRYVVITSVDRDDLRDGGAAHFAACVAEVRRCSPGIRVEILVPDFRGRMAKALAGLDAAPPDVFNHNLETVPRLYKKAGRVPITPGPWI